VSDGQVLPFAEIDCDGVRGFLMKDLLMLSADAREEAYGKALGRVLSHELYHIFAKTVHHGAAGVAKAAYTVRELLSQDFQFEEKETRTLRATKPRPIPDTNVVVATEDSHPSSIE